VARRRIVRIPVLYPGDPATQPAANRAAELRRISGEGH
jgi:hypothetical protein